MIWNKYNGVRHGSVLSPTLFNVMMDKTVNKVREENRRLDMKTLISADDALIWGKAEKENKRNYINGTLLWRNTEWEWI